MNVGSEHTYRQRPYFRNLGIVCTLLFACAWIGSVLAAYFNVDGSFAKPGLFIAFSSVVFGSFVLLGVWLILRFFKFQLILANDSIRQIGVLRSKRIILDAVQELKWRIRPKGGSCVLTSVGSKLAIEFD